MARSTIRSRFWRISSFLLIFNALPLLGQDIYLCVWRNPERTMTKIFPDARDYKTVNHALAPQEREVIEAKVGFTLLPGQRDQFQYFEMTGEGGKRIGTIIAASQKGEFGAIEFVFGMDTLGVIKGIYIQRSRERDTRFKERKFLDQFVGKKNAQVIAFTAAFKGEKNRGIDAVINGLKKELVTFEEVTAKEKK